MKDHQTLKIHEVENGWLVKIIQADGAEHFTINPIYVFITQKDLGRFVEDFYTKKDEH